MQTIRFRGRVLPEPAEISINSAPTVHWKVDEWQFAIETVCRIEKSKVEVTCQLPNWRPEYFDEIYRRAFDLCRAMVDVVGFKMAWGLTVIFDTFETPDGNITSLLLRAPQLEQLCTAFSLEQGFDAVCRHVLQRPLLFMAMRELITAITLPHVSLVECARAMDRIKNLLASPGLKDKAAWAQMRAALRIDEIYLKYITDASANPRHGQPGHTPGTVTTEVSRRAWVVMNRYLEYLVRGEQPLDPATFPVIDR